MTGEKLIAICIVLVIAGSPFLFWLVLYFANPLSPDDLKKQIARVKRLRWVLYIAGVALGVFWIVDQMPKNYWIFGSAVISASAGLVFPDTWLKNRLARSEQMGPTAPIPSRRPCK